MLSPDENPGIFYFLVGMVVLVMTAVGMSLLIDKRLKFSSGAGEMAREISVAGEELAALRIRHETRSSTLAEAETMRKASSVSLPEIIRDTKLVDERLARLSATKESLGDAINKTERAFSAYRVSYRNKTWADAVGQKFAVLAIRGGREFREVTITKVTDVGLEIRHEHGIARIQAPDLDQEWQDRFQWSDEERRNILRAETAALEVVQPAPNEGEPETITPREAVPAKKGGTGDDAEQLELLRVQVRAWTSKVGRLRAEQSMASANASYGNQPSVPGSLETWKARSARLSNELVRAKVELSLARSRLAAVSPDDALLRPQVGDSP